MLQLTLFPCAIWIIEWEVQLPVNWTWIILSIDGNNHRCNYFQSLSILQTNVKSRAIFLRWLIQYPLSLRSALFSSTLRIIHSIADDASLSLYTSVWGMVEKGRHIRVSIWLAHIYKIGIKSEVHVICQCNTRTHPLSLSLPMLFTVHSQYVPIFLPLPLYWQLLGQF